MFGNPSPAPNTGGGLFGASNNNAQAPSGGLFGSQQQQPTQPPTGGLFGNNQNQQTQQPASGGLFGNSQQPQQGSGGLFGNNNAGGGLFGARPLAGAPTLPALSTNPTGGSSLFGGGSLGQQPTQSSSFFSPPAQNQNQQQQRPGLFGAASTNNIFGASTNNNSNAAKPAFGDSLGLGLGQSQQQPQNPLGTSILSTSSLRPPAAGSGGPAQQQADAQTQFTRLTARIEGITAAWDARSPQCQFQYFFYNRVDPNQVGLYGRPPNATNDVLWAKAVRENPDPTCLVPAIAVGFDDLRQRVDAQGQQAAAHQERLKDLKSPTDYAIFHSNSKHCPPRAPGCHTNTTYAPPARARCPSAPARTGSPFLRHPCGGGDVARLAGGSEGGCGSTRREWRWWGWPDAGQTG
ncbi:hypothetical protein C8R46DRAFT_1341205 [Mycena filopes]|nr:hypothetical protein C8R46DRAFT_1341205 [Mycena filopes]